MIASLMIFLWFLVGNVNLISENETQSSSILGMILLEDQHSFDVQGAMNELKSKWKLDVGIVDGNSDALVVEIEDYKVAMALMPVPIPGDEISQTAGYNYFWENAEDETSQHQAHIVLTVMNTGREPITENMLFSKIASAVMNHSGSIGIYMGSRTLLLQKNFYDYFTTVMSDDNLPLYLWIYFGLRQDDSGQSVYTYGLNEFGFKEMEIVHSSKDMDHLGEMMYNMVHHVVLNNVTLNDGETIGMSATQMLKITESKGVFLDGTTLKIEY